MPEFYTKAQIDAQATIVGNRIKTQLQAQSGSGFVWANGGQAFDGTTDYHSSIQASIDALDAAGGGVLMLPSGTAKLGDRLVVPDNITLRGMGAEVTKLKSVLDNGSLPNGSLIYAHEAKNIGLSSFGLIGNGRDSGTAGMGILVDQTTHFSRNVLLEDIKAEEFPEDGIRLDVVILATLARLHVTRCGETGINFVDDPSLGGGTSATLLNCYAGACKVSGIRLRSMTYSDVINCAAEYCQLGYDITGCSNVGVMRCGGEIQWAYTTDPCRHFRINGCWNTTVSQCFAAHFANVTSGDAEHLFVEWSDGVTIEGFRGKSDLGGGEELDAATACIHLDDATNGEIKQTGQLRFSGAGIPATPVIGTFASSGSAAPSGYESAAAANLTKTNDNDISTSGTDQLVISSIAEGDYYLEAMLVFTVGVNTDFHSQIIATNATGVVQAVTQNNTDTSPDKAQRSVVGGLDATILSAGDDSNPMAVNYTGRVTIASGQTGELKLAWAQNVASTSVLTLYAGSYLRLTPAP